MIRRELHYSQLKKKCNPEDFTFQTTKELQPLEGIIGQERAVKAFNFGLGVKLKGYNIYMSGPSGAGKTTYASQKVKEVAAEESIPKDWCYVYNFQDPKRPLTLKFDAGIGKQFKNDMTQLVSIVKKELQKAFNDEEYDNQKNILIHSFEKQQEEIVYEMDQMAQSYDFALKNTESGIYFMPIVNGEVLEEEAYLALTKEEKDEIDRRTLVIQEKASSYMREIMNLEKECEKQADALERKVGLNAIGHHIENVTEKYRKHERVVEYLASVKNDILEHLEQFAEVEESEGNNLLALLPMISKKSEEDITEKYGVNLIVDHSETKGAPVIISFNPTYSNLMGEVEYGNEYGNLTTDFMKIKGGLFHQANGGYLIVQAQDILTSPHAWEALRRVIKTKEINMDSTREFLNITAAPMLKPEPIPAQFKTIMVGSDQLYALLSECDEEFDKFFKIRADFDYEMERTDENCLKIAKFIKGFVERENTLEFDISAVCLIIEHSSRSTERQDKLSTRFNYLSEILGEADAWAKLEDALIISKQHVAKAIYEKEQRMKLYEEKLNEMLQEDVIMIDTDGAKIGQINGLAVLNMGNYSFGTPARITATTYVGKSGIVNIEKEARMSGQTHDKGVQIITGYLGQTYAQKFPMALSCRVCFEQNYNGIDGDSASSTELYCILSSLAELPIRQDLAVTGSVNQKGEIQAIGGVTYKIEGFFEG